MSNKGSYSSQRLNSAAGKTHFVRNDIPRKQQNVTLEFVLLGVDTLEGLREPGMRRGELSHPEVPSPELLHVP